MMPTVSISQHPLYYGLPRRAPLRKYKALEGATGSAVSAVWLCEGQWSRCRIPFRYPVGTTTISTSLVGLPCVITGVTVSEMNSSFPAPSSILADME
jgi:hypothetical protein